MIKVLKNWREIEEMTKFLSRNRLPRHLICEKNWDLGQLCNIVSHMPRKSKIIDLGCGGLEVLKLLYASGFRNLYGVDLNLSIRSRVSQVMMMVRKRSFFPVLHLKKCDLTKTNFSNATFDLAVCVSVIEHGVDVDEFFKESSRILVPGGILFITTDYWENKVNVKGPIKPPGMSWKIFSKEDIERVLERASCYGFELCEPSFMLDCSDRCVVWDGEEFTFLNIIFKKK